jgi:hypothetical protein
MPPEFIFFIAAIPIPIPIPEPEPEPVPIDDRLLILPIPPVAPNAAGVDVVVVNCGRCWGCDAPGGGVRLKPEKVEAAGVVIVAPGGGGRAKEGVRFWVCCCWLRDMELKADVSGGCCCWVVGGDDQRLLVLVLVLFGAAAAPQLRDVV